MWIDEATRAPGRLALKSLAHQSLHGQYEGEAPFWLSGQFGSLAAAPQVPGWSVGIITYIDSATASGNVAAAREITINRFNPKINVDLNLNLTARSLSI